MEAVSILARMNLQERFQLMGILKVPLYFLFYEIVRLDWNSRSTASYCLFRSSFCFLGCCHDYHVTNHCGIQEVVVSTLSIHSLTDNDTDSMFNVNIIKPS